MFNTINFVKNFGETKQSFLNSTKFLSVNCSAARQRSTFSSQKKLHRLILLPLLRKILNKFSKMIKTTATTVNSPKLIYKLDWLGDVSRTGYTTTTANTTLKSEKTNNFNNTCTENLLNMSTNNFDLNLETIYIIFCLNDKYEVVLNDIKNQQNKSSVKKNEIKTQNSSICKCLRQIQDKFKFESNINVNKEPFVMTDFVIQNFLFIEKIEEIMKKDTCNKETAQQKVYTKENIFSDDEQETCFPSPTTDYEYLDQKCRVSKMDIMDEEKQGGDRPPPEKRRKKRRRKNNNSHRLSPSCQMNSNNNKGDKYTLDTKQKKKRKKLKKRQRNYDRDEKERWQVTENTKIENENNSLKKISPCCSTIRAGCNQATVCISLKMLPPTSPLPPHFTFPQQSYRERQISECSSDSLEICFMGDFNDDDDEDDDDVNNDERYTRYLRDSETDSDSGLLDERKVRFNLKPEVHVIRHWDFAHRQARKGQWEEIARDRFRFSDRIRKLDDIISPILDKNHRDKIFYKRFL